MEPKKITLPRGRVTEEQMLVWLREAFAAEAYNERLRTRLSCHRWQYWYEQASYQKTLDHCKSKAFAFRQMLCRASHLVTRLADYSTWCGRLAIVLQPTKRRMRAVARDITSVRDCVEILAKPRQHLDWSAVYPSTPPEVLLTFITDFEDCSTLYQSSGPLERETICEILLEDVQRLEKAGGRVRFAIHTDEDCKWMTTVLIGPNDALHLMDQSELMVPCEFRPCWRWEV